MYVCVREKERERQTEAEREREMVAVGHVYVGLMNERHEWL